MVRNIVQNITVYKALFIAFLLVAATGPSTDRVAVSSASRLNTLDDKEKELVLQIQRYKEGLQRNENKDQVYQPCAIVDTGLMLCDNYIL